MPPATCYSRVMPRSTNKIIKRLRWSRHIMGDLGLDWSLTQVSVSLSSSSSSWCRDTLTLLQSDITPEHQSSCLMRRCDTGGMKVHWTQWLLRSGWLSGALLHGDNDNWSQCETWDTGIRSLVIMATGRLVWMIISYSGYSAWNVSREHLSNQGFKKLQFSNLPP